MTGRRDPGRGWIRSRGISLTDGQFFFVVMAALAIVGAALYAGLRCII